MSLRSRKRIYFVGPLREQVCSMKILREIEMRNDATALDEAWLMPDTFAFLPDKLSLSMGHVC